MSRSTRHPFLGLLAALATACSSEPGGAAAPVALQAPGSRRVTASSATLTELRQRAEQVAGGGTQAARAERIVRWVHENVAFTPERHATLDALLRDRNGNCYDHASLVLAMLRQTGIRARYVRELNVEPPSEMRATSAREQMSVLYGYEHNDHTWVEIEAEGRWLPADSSLGLFGVREWLGARVLNGAANEYGMITPFVLVAFDGDAPVDRTRAYLQTSLAATFPAVTRSAAWPQWQEDVTSFADGSVRIFGPRPEVALDPARVHRMASAVSEFRQISGAAVGPEPIERQP